MKTHFSIILTLLLATTAAYAQNDNDSTISRNVVVEREFQPIIQSAGKVNLNPLQVETTIEPVEVKYSTFSKSLESSYNLTTLGSSAIKFNRPRPTNGWLEVGGGYPLTWLDFGYRLNTKTNTNINLYANHDGRWGIKSDASSKIGMSFLQRLSLVDIFFNVEGSHLFYTRYGRYYDGDNKLRKKYGELTRDDKQHIFEADANIGIRSNSLENFSLLLQTGYNAFILPKHTTEHNIRTRAEAAWINEENSAGINIYVQNAFYSVDKAVNLNPALYNARHAMRFEPYYQFSSLNWQVHAGVNIDMNVGKGQMMSGNGNISFAPSPNVEIEYRILPSMLAVYANAKGQFGAGTLQGYMATNPYFDIIPGITSHHVSAYTPADAAIGFKIKPMSTMLIDVYGGFAHMRNQTTLCAPTFAMLHSSDKTYLDYFYSDYNRWKVGAELLYHYQDIVNIRLSGNYYHWQLLNLEAPAGMTYDNSIAYDRPSWDLGLRVDVNIDSKWSVYSDNCVQGSKFALLADGTNKKLKPYIDLNLGARYNVNRWLYVYAQLNNYLHRHNDIYYGYQSQGINGEIGFHWDF